MERIQLFYPMFLNILCDIKQKYKTIFLSLSLSLSHNWDRGGVNYSWFQQEKEPPITFKIPSKKLVMGYLFTQTEVYPFSRW